MPPYSPFLHNKGEPLLFTELQNELDRLNAPGLHVAIVKTMRVGEKDDASFNLYVTAPGNPHHFAVVWLAWAQDETDYFHSKHGAPDTEPLGDVHFAVPPPTPETLSTPRRILNGSRVASSPTIPVDLFASMDEEVYDEEEDEDD